MARKPATLQKKILQLRAQMSELQTQESKLLEELESVCDHSKVDQYYWEHDNGYGKQTDQVGNQCVFCRAVDYYRNGHFVPWKDAID